MNRVKRIINFEGENSSIVDCKKMKELPNDERALFILYYLEQSEDYENVDVLFCDFGIEGWNKEEHKKLKEESKDKSKNKSQQEVKAANKKILDNLIIEYTKKTFDYIIKEETVEEIENSKIEAGDADKTCVPNNEEDGLALSDCLTYYGTIEENFSTIINPREAGIKKFWKLINFYWSAYFSIILPLYEKIGDMRDGNGGKYQNPYSYILSNVDAITREVYEKTEIKKDSYYGVISNYQSVNHKKIKILTTNYTPFIEKLSGEENSAYLAGALKLFEYPGELEIVDFSQESDGNNVEKKKMFFPFIMTQAPIKPIIHPKQLVEYKKAMEFLDLEQDVIDKTLIIVGYNLNPDDDHINAMIREFVVKGGKLVIYKHNKEKKEEEVEESVKKSLRLINNKDIRIDVVAEDKSGDKAKFKQMISKHFVAK